MTGKCSTGGGFTLIELLVGLVLVSVLALLLVRVFNQAGDAWSMGEANKERLQNLRAIGDFISNELQSALLPVNRPDTKNLQFIVNPVAIPADYKNRDAIFWQSPLATDQTLGDVAEVGYFVKWDTSKPANPRALLCRFFVNPAKKDATGNVAPDPDFLIYSHPADWISSVLARVAPADAANAYQGLFAENVLGLWVQCFDSGGQSLMAGDDSFDSRSGYTDSLLGARPACALPATVQFSLVFLDARSAARVDPALQARIVQLAKNSADASAFVAAALADPVFGRISPGMRAYRTKVFLQNAK